MFCFYYIRFCFCFTFLLAWLLVVTATSFWPTKDSFFLWPFWIKLLVLGFCWPLTLCLLQEVPGAVVNGHDQVTGHIISTTIGGKNGEPKQTISYMAERVVGTGSFGIVFQAKCLETGETVAIKKVLQDRRYKNRELQLMRVMDHPNVVCLKHCFFSTTSKDELFLNLVMEYVPESLYRVLKHYSTANQRMPLVYVKLYMYQVTTTHLKWFILKKCLVWWTFCVVSDLQGTCVHAQCCWSLSQRSKASKSSGMR